MKFQSSELESRYNKYWDDNVVNLDGIIRSVSLGFNFLNGTKNVGELISEYRHRILNVFSNLERRMDAFEDKEYIQDYLKNTLSQGVEDLSFYQKIFPEYAAFCEQYISELNSKMPNVNNERSFSLTASGMA
ncbi:hypothetical protein J2N86_14365 (plasmid) [Legionella lytica]|uniref:Bile acid beta-glucosidase n=1 Tax=Legionella lytica TaxID=96232 RepID=A0ABY4YDU8_9GAMM|nr:hypothetical protein [Legionella lytica]USQ15425.1 hypothetical protein J2N86_14365 [Legionella lytica]